MPKSLDEIRTTHVIVDIHLGARESARIRLAKTLIESALAGNKNSQNRICIVVKKVMNNKGGRYRWIEWNPTMMTGYYEDRNEEKASYEESPLTGQEVYEALVLFEMEPKPMVSKKEILCECVISTV